ncbi:hypothetical protein UFOVP650_76 [uncultured Caudovirales phage]|uniref:Uncharacterized protein n=1 Tax=uncultured Caudovirales phage TaxID=2100421 RepID=A0A6J5NC60_9CAUD|nr:hypothetical protein UFOVP650_76 [uncultured Caudovirales phage]
MTKLELVARQLAAHNDMVEIRKSARQLAAERSAGEITALLRQWRKRQTRNGEDNGEHGKDQA